MNRKKNADLIHAWVEGAQIQIKTASGWADIDYPQWHPNHEYRVKPSTVRKCGWAIICKNKKIYMSSTIYACEKEAIDNMPICGVAVVPVEWEE